MTVLVLQVVVVVVGRVVPVPVVVMQERARVRRARRNAARLTAPLLLQLLLRHACYAAARRAASPLPLLLLHGQQARCLLQQASLVPTLGPCRTPAAAPFISMRDLGPTPSPYVLMQELGPSLFVLLQDLGPPPTLRPLLQVLGPADAASNTVPRAATPLPLQAPRPASPTAHALTPVIRALQRCRGRRVVGLQQTCTLFRQRCARRGRRRGGLQALLCEQRGGRAPAGLQPLSRGQR